MGFGVRLTWVAFWLYYSVVGCSWTNALTIRSLSFITNKIGVVVRIKPNDAYKVLSTVVGQVLGGTVLTLKGGGDKLKVYIPC